MPSMLRAVLSPRMGLCVLLGFSSGLPFYVIESLIPVWLADRGIELSTIGALAFLSLPYSLKFLWAPLLDRYAPAGLGRRRAWALGCQAVLLAAIAAIGLCAPERTLLPLIALCFVVALASATQDVALDAYRREILEDAELGLGSSLFVQAYRVSILVPGSLGLVLSESGVSWALVFAVVAGGMTVGLGTSLLMPEPRVETRPSRTLLDDVVASLEEFASRAGDGGRQALTILAFIVLYKLGDVMATTLIKPIYLELGFSKGEIAQAVPVGTAAAIVGSLFGGLVMLRLGINRALWVFGVVQMASILGFAVLASSAPDLRLLMGVVTFEYLGVGLGTAAFVAFIARETDRRFTATQFALFTSVAALPRTGMRATAGVLVESVGYVPFFLICTLLAIPGMLLLPRVAPWSGLPPEHDQDR